MAGVLATKTVASNNSDGGDSKSSEDGGAAGKTGSSAVTPRRRRSLPPQTLLEAAAASADKRDAAAALRPPATKKTLGGGKWTKAEDALLREAVKAVGPKNWRRISAEYLHGQRSDVQCLHRWQKVLRPGLVKGPWTPVEDSIIIKSIS